MGNSFRAVFIFLVVATFSVQSLHGMKLFQQLKAVSFYQCQLSLPVLYILLFIYSIRSRLIIFRFSLTEK